jgi:polyisoprenoid-binding protein YceI
MKMFAAMLIALSTTFAMAQSYKVDSSASSIKWVGKKVTGQHAGTLAVKDGTFTFTGDLLTAGEVNVDMNTLAVTDIPASDENNGKLVGHLKSPDFFNVAKHPAAKLVITSSTKTASGLKIKGNLTFVGKTNPIEFDAKVVKTDASVNTKATVALDRTKWDLKYGSGDFFKGLGDKAINNEFEITVDITAKK